MFYKTKGSKVVGRQPSLGRRRTLRVPSPKLWASIPSRLPVAHHLAFQSSQLHCSLSQTRAHSSFWLLSKQWKLFQPPHPALQSLGCIEAKAREEEAGESGAAGAAPPRYEWHPHRSLVVRFWEDFMGITTTWRGREEQEFGSPWDNLGSRPSSREAFRRCPQEP